VRDDHERFEVTPLPREDEYNARVSEFYKSNHVTACNMNDIHSRLDNQDHEENPQRPTPNIKHASGKPGKLRRVPPKNQFAIPGSEWEHLPAGKQGLLRDRDQFESGGDDDDRSYEHVKDYSDRGLPPYRYDESGARSSTDSNIHRKHQAAEMDDQKFFGQQSSALSPYSSSRVEDSPDASTYPDRQYMDEKGYLSEVAGDDGYGYDSPPAYTLLPLEIVKHIRKYDTKSSFNYGLKGS
jgi:hypothetical protein